MHDLSYLDQVINYGQSHEWSGNRADLAELAVLFAGSTITALDALLDVEVKIAAILPRKLTPYDENVLYVKIFDSSLLNPAR